MAEPIRPNRSAGSLHGSQPVLSAQNLEAMRIQNSPQNRMVQEARRTAEETSRGNRLLTDLLDSNASQDARERLMLRWTIAGVSLSGIAALTGVVALVVALAK